MVACLPACARAIARADLIVFSPGSLMTGIISVLLTRGIRTALRASRALTVQVVNIMTQPGQTDAMSARDHIDAISQYLGRAPDVAIVNSKHPPERWLHAYRRDRAEPVRVDVEGLPRTRVIRADLLEPRGKDVLTLYARRAGRRMIAVPHVIRHDPARLGRILRSLT